MLDLTGYPNVISHQEFLKEKGGLLHQLFHWFSVWPKTLIQVQQDVLSYCTNSALANKRTSKAKVLLGLEI
jgi:hypothetical protein